MGPGSACFSPRLDVLTGDAYEPEKIDTAESNVPASSADRITGEHADGNTAEHEWLDEAFAAGLESTEKTPSVATSVRDLLNNANRTFEDEQKALKIAQNAACDGDAGALAELGLMHRMGYGGLSKDFAAARECYRRSAALGSPLGQARLGNIIRKENALKEDSGKPCEGIDLIKSSAAQGDPLGMAYLGTVYSNRSLGYGHFERTPVSDAAKAKELLFRASAEGEPEADLVLSFHYRHGRLGLPKSADKAVYHVRRAAEKGNPAAMGIYGDFFEHGFGSLAADPAQHDLWIAKAAAQGDPSASRRFEEQLKARQRARPSKSALKLAKFFELLRNRENSY